MMRLLLTIDVPAKIAPAARAMVEAFVAELPRRIACTATLEDEPKPRTIPKGKT